MSELSHAGADGALHTTFGALSEPPLSPPVLGSGAPALVDSGPTSVPAAEPMAPVQTPPAPVSAAPQSARPLSQDDIAKLPLQALLVRAAYLTVDQLSQALTESVTSGRPVEEIAVERGWVAGTDVEQLVQAKQAATGEMTASVSPVPSPDPVPGPEPTVAPESISLPQASLPPESAPEPPVPVVPFQTPVPPPAAQPTPAEVPAAPAPPPAPDLQAVPMPEPVMPEFAPVQEPAPPAMPAPAPAASSVAPHPEPVDETIGVFLHLTSGERVWIDRFATQEAAEQYAQELVRQLMRPELGIWPRFGGRLVRPEAVVSVELSGRGEY